jgi:prevent-host-death family protein
MKAVSVHEAKAHFSALLKEVETGEVVIITRHDTPVAEIRPAYGPANVPVLGAFAQPGSVHLEVLWTDEELDEILGDKS